ncbi:hypothetical protein SKAU_G00275660 [Synaphobranchus kaupii]|uniref:Uncharacterized protein n=1 Tax=Synaphobranchus kaupii TaxID=118154 RepID=A0A9Q1IQU2_SYNKA|nr:hypothetical protein SKAU_G00275660 [Synaphobranchus kaupii]
MLRDRIVCGVLDEALQRRLLAEPNHTFNEAEEKALAAETAFSNARLLHPERAGPSAVGEIHQTAHSQTAKKEGKQSKQAKGITVEGVHQVFLQSLESILTEYAEVFQEFGACRNPPVSIDIDLTVTPKFFKARPYHSPADPSWIN